MKRTGQRSVHRDPHAKREAGRYEQPIASRELIMELLDSAPAPMTLEELSAELGYEERSQQALVRRLAAMVRDGQLFQNRRQAYAVVSKADLIVGTVIGHADGFGFLRPDDGSDDLFLSPKQMRSLMHGDHALVRQDGLDRRGRREAKLVEILKRAVTQVAGHYYEESGIGFMVPQNRRLQHDILVPPSEKGDAKHGDVVLAEIIEYPDKRHQPIGRIVRVLGQVLERSMHTDVAIHNFGLPYRWPETLDDELACIKDDLPGKEIKNRLDVRDLPLVTIDGEDARDFDDAVWCEPAKKGWRLLVAIADVSWYVEAGSALDQEAWERSTSTYFPDRVIPMLPERLSNGLCSINPGVDRFCMLCEMHITDRGKLDRYRFHEAVMRSHARLTYTEVAAMLVDGNRSIRKRHAEILPHLENLHELYRALARARSRRGAIDFESNETGFVFDDDGKVIGVSPLTRNDAHRMIEECMIAANVAAARYLEKHELPALFRVHAGPEADDLQKLRDFLQAQGLSLGGGDRPSPKDYARLLDDVRERSDAHVIQMVLLRSLKQAVYTGKNEGHFGLSLNAYAHFTSPIRRYPDLLVHRAIRHHLRGGTVNNYGYSKAFMEKAGQHCSALERRADEASWDVVEALKCEYLADHVGQEFDGVVSGVNNFGLFVELEDLNISGLVHVTALGNDYFHFDPTHHRLVGEHTRSKFQLGETMRVRLVRVNIDERKIDLEPVSLPKKLRGSGRPKRRRYP